jgi:serine/threonine protein kinase
MRTIGKYEVVEKIGEGGFGTVFKGFDPHIRRFVAIKACTSEEQDVRDRFAHEAQIAGNLQHRHIVTVYDYGLQDEVPYLVQEYLSGEDLDRKIKRKDVIPLPEKLLYLVHVARGLEYAHSRGVIHRDIKPANIRILEDGSARIMDFGIAKLANQDTGLTQTGMTLGTAAYLAPEQIKGQAVGPGTDIFSWGVTAWELLSYQRPFGGQHISTVLYQILNEQPPPLREAAPDCPAAVEAVISRCLAKDPERRYPSCTELLADLDKALRSSRRSPADSGFGTLVGGLAAAATATRSSPPPTPAAPVRAAPPPLPAADTTPPRPPDPGLHDFDLDATSDRTPHSISSTQALRNRGFAWGRWAAGVTIGVALLLVAAAAVREAMQRPPRAITAAAEPPQGGGISLAASAEGPQALVIPEPPLAATPEPTPEPTPTPTPTPRPSTLVVPAAWSPDVFVVVGGQRRSLGQRQRFEVPPGVSTRVRFEYREEDYADDATRSVRVAEGATEELAVPLAPPGLIQVQQRVNTPPGRVFLDGEATAGGLFRKKVKAGRHKIRVEPASGSATPIDRDVEVPAGKKLVLTFDLATGDLFQVVGPLEPGG